MEPTDAPKCAECTVLILRGDNWTHCYVCNRVYHPRCFKSGHKSCLPEGVTNG